MGGSPQGCRGLHGGKGPRACICHRAGGHLGGVLIWGHCEQHCEEPSSVSLDNQGRRASQLSPVGRGLLGTKSAWFSSSDFQLLSFQYQLPLLSAACESTLALRSGPRLASSAFCILAPLVGI